MTENQGSSGTEMVSVSGPWMDWQGGWLERFVVFFLLIFRFLFPLKQNWVTFFFRFGYEPKMNQPSIFRVDMSVFSGILFGKQLQFE